MSSLAQSEPSAEHLGSLLEFETLISDLSSRFINLPPGEVDREIEDALRRVCEPLGIDLAVLWQWSAAAPGVIVPTHAYCAAGRPAPDRADAPGAVPLVREQVLAGRLFAVSSLEDLPAEAAVDRETCRLFGIQSALCLPLSVGGEPPVGALGFNTLRAQRDWPDALVKRLQLVAQVFTNALARRRHELSLRESEARLKEAADLAGLGFYEVDLGARAVFVDDRFADVCGIPPEASQGLGILEFWIEHLHPDDRQRVLEQRQELHDGQAGAAHHRVPLPASDPRREVDSSRGPRRATRRQRTRDQDVRRPPRHHGAPASARRRCGSRTRRSSG